MNEQLDAVVWEAARTLKAYRQAKTDGTYVDEQGQDVADALDDLLAQIAEQP